MMLVVAGAITETLSGAAAGLLGGMAIGVVPLAVLGGMLFRARRQREKLAADNERAREIASELEVWLDATRKQLDAMPDWLMRVDATGTILDSNEPRQTGFDGAAAGAAGKALHEVVPPSIQRTLTKTVAETVDNQRAQAFEFSWQEGKAYGEARVVPLDDGTAMVALRDKTAQRTREGRLQQSKTRFALALEGANDGLWDWDLDRDHMYYSYAWKTMLGYRDTPIEATPEAWISRIHPDDRETMQAALQAHLDGADNRFESEHRMQQADGTWLWVLARGKAQRNAAGKATRLVGSLTDLTNRRVVQVTQEKASLLEHATSSVHIGIGVYRGQGRGLGRVSDTLRAMTDAWPDVDAWWRTAVTDLAPPAEQTCPVCGGPQWVGTVFAECTTPAGQPKVFEVAFTGHAHEVSERDGTHHVLLIKDVTQRVLAERSLRTLNDELVTARDAALAASRAKTTFLANMSHELRTPLNHILGYAEMLQEELEDAEMDDLTGDVDKILHSGRDLLGKVAGILEFTQLDGDDAVTTEGVDLSAVVHQAVADAQTALARQGNQVSLAIADRLTAKADGPKVRRILDILLDNAGKFCRDGHITIRAGQDDGHAVVEVEDTGIGLSKATQEGLFAAFYQADQSYSRNHDGVGLSLALAGRMTQLMGGTLGVESVEGEGATFRLRLPA